MAPPIRVRWARTPAGARVLQLRLRNRVVRVDRMGRVRYVAGADASHDPREGLTHAAVVVLRLPELTAVELATATRPLRFPYVPGLLSFREAPALLAALRRLRTRPDLLLVDGHGLAHPRRFGIACHVGVLTGIPTIGVGKSRLVGTHAEPGMARGRWSPLQDRGETIGAALRTQRGVRPIYVSTGHRVSLRTAVEAVLRCAPRYRLPEPIRAADCLSRVR